MHAPTRRRRRRAHRNGGTPGTPWRVQRVPSQLGTPAVSHAGVVSRAGGEGDPAPQAQGPPSACRARSMAVAGGSGRRGGAGPCEQGRASRRRSDAIHRHRVLALGRWRATLRVSVHVGSRRANARARGSGGVRSGAVRTVAVTAAGLCSARRVSFRVRASKTEAGVRYASWLVAEGEDPAYVVQQLGHTDPKMTLGLYARALQSKRRHPPRGAGPMR